MSYSSDSVKKWRENVKSRAVKAMGGKCQKCGYDYCNEALDFHYLEPSKKEFSFGKIIGNPVAQEKIAEELTKCIILCSNCHREFHAGKTNIDGIVCLFNKSDFISIREKALDNCPICNKLKPIKNRTCSLACGGKIRSKISWSTIDLEDLKINKKLSNEQIADLLGVSGNAVRKHWKKYDSQFRDRT